jgi:hypothetical protein
VSEECQRGDSVGNELVSSYCSQCRAVSEKQECSGVSMVIGESYNWLCAMAIL